jgi:hypothetical protein
VKKAAKQASRRRRANLGTLQDTLPIQLDPPMTEILRQRIIDLRLQGHTYLAIAKALRCAESTVSRICVNASIPRGGRAAIPDKDVFPVGALHLKTALSYDQLCTLDKLRTKWGCETIAETALELIRDAIAENPAP